MQNLYRKRVLSLSTVFMLAVTVSGCGGGSSSVDDVDTGGGGGGATDTVAPVITLNGNSTVTITQGDSYSEAGATASDDVDGDISVNISTGGDTVDTATVGSYTITYNVSDAAGNAAVQVSRMVNVTAVPIASSYNMPPLNDTGLLIGGNFPTGNNADCSGETVSEQDCSTGRDKQAADGNLSKTGAGQAGFDFTKLGSDGAPLAIQNQTWDDLGNENLGTQWSCVKDNHTGLIWETKVNLLQGSGLHSKGDFFYWYSTDDTNNAGLAGTDKHPSGSSTCTGQDQNDSSTYCNTQAFIGRVNSENLCGGNNWRLPNVHELQSIVHYGKSTSPAIDTDYFPNTFSSTDILESAFGGFFWSSTHKRQILGGGQIVVIDFSHDAAINSVTNIYYGNGKSEAEYKNVPHSARLVRTAH